MKHTITELVKGTIATFVCFRDGDLWYKIGLPGECRDCGAPEADIFSFPIPISDTGTGIFECRMKAITLMRWVRKHYEKIEKGDWANGTEST